MKYTFLLLLSVVLFSCSKTKKLHNRLMGEWNIERVVGSVIDSVSTKAFDQADAGSFLFKEVSTLVTPQDGKYTILAKDKSNGQTLVYESEETIGWENDAKTVTTDNHDGKRIVWTVIANGTTTQEWSCDFYSDKEKTKHIFIDHIYLKKK